MLYDLKNVRTTYQCLANKIFEDPINQNMEVYVNDMLVKSSEKVNHIKNLEKIFNALSRYQMKLNPNKCTLDVTISKFLGLSPNKASRRILERSKRSLTFGNPTSKKYN